MANVVGAWTPVTGTDVFHPQGSQRRMFLQEGHWASKRLRGVSAKLRSTYCDISTSFCGHEAFAVYISSQPGDILVSLR